MLIEITVAFVAKAIGGLIVSGGGAYIFWRWSNSEEGNDTEAPDFQRQQEARHQRETAHQKTIDSAISGIIQETSRLQHSSQASLDEMSKLKTSLEQNTTTISLETEALSKTNKKLQQCIQEQETAMQKLIENFQSKVSQLEQTIQELRTLKETQEKMLAKTSEKLTATSQELSLTTKKVEQLSAEIGVKKMQFTSIDTQVKDLKQELTRYQRALERSHLEKTRLVTLNTQLVKQVEAFHQLTEKLSETEPRTPTALAPTPSPRFFN